MEISIVPQVSPTLPPVFARDESDRGAAASRHVAVAQTAVALASELIALDDGGVAIGLDPSDALEPHWAEWNVLALGGSDSAADPLSAWEDAFHGTATSHTALALAADLVSLDDGGIAIGLDGCADVEPQWFAWNEWVDARRRSRTRIAFTSAGPAPSC